MTADEGETFLEALVDTFYKPKPYRTQLLATGSSASDRSPWRAPNGAAARSSAGRMMRLLLNVVWLVCCGICMWLAYVVAGLVICLFVVTILFGIVSFRIAGYALWPFVRTVVSRPAPSEDCRRRQRGGRASPAVTGTCGQRVRRTGSAGSPSR